MSAFDFVSTRVQTLAAHNVIKDQLANAISDGREIDVVLLNDQLNGSIKKLSGLGFSPELIGAPVGEVSAELDEIFAESLDALDRVNLWMSP